MNTYRLVYVPTGRTVATVTRADRWWEKGWGVLGQRALAAGEGLWLPGVASVHTLGVGFPLDLLFLDDALKTLKIAENVSTGRMLIRAGGASHTLELGAGTLASMAVPVSTGDLWRMERETPTRC